MYTAAICSCEVTQLSSLSLFLFLQALCPNSNKILILTACILNMSTCFSMNGTHILVLMLQLIIFNLFRDYKKLRFRPFPSLVFTFVCKLGCWLDGVALKRKFEHGSNTVLRDSKADRTVSPVCHGLMHLFTHKHSATKAGENKPQTVSKLEILKSQNATGFVALFLFLFFLPYQTLRVTV